MIQLTDTLIAADMSKAEAIWPKGTLFPGNFIGKRLGEQWEVIGLLSEVTEEQAKELYSPMSGIGPNHTHKSALVIALQSKGIDTSKPETILLIQKVDK